VSVASQVPLEYLVGDEETKPEVPKSAPPPPSTANTNRAGPEGAVGPAPANSDKEAKAVKGADSAAIAQVPKAAIPPIDAKKTPAEDTLPKPTAAGLFPQGCLVEIACGEEGEKEVWMPARVGEVIFTKERKSKVEGVPLESLSQDDGESADLLLRHKCRTTKKCFRWCCTFTRLFPTSSQSKLTKCRCSGTKKRAACLNLRITV
jgi:hypothetical protein